MSDTVAKLIPDSQLTFQPPTIISGGMTFTFPIGPEGFRRSGSSQIGIHKYIGDNVVAANVIHFDEGHIELNGTLPGISSPRWMSSLIDVLHSTKKKILRAPGVFPREQYVETENYDFSHSPDDRSHSIEYSISFLKVGSGDEVAGVLDTAGIDTLSGRPSTVATPHSTARGSQSLATMQFRSGRSVPIGPEDEPYEMGRSELTATRSAQARSARFFQVIDGVDTFRMIAQYVYGDADQASKLVELNTEVISKNNPGSTVKPYELIYHRWPRGTRVAY
jgi:hypothetical protein